MSRLPWKNLNAQTFEDLCAEFLQHIGFHDISREGGVGDQGIDLIAKTEMGSSPVVVPATWWVQCKRAKRSISAKDLAGETRNATAGDCDVYLVMTTGKLTADARQWIDRHNSSGASFKIHYLDGDALADQLLSSDFPLHHYFGEDFERESADPAVLAEYVDKAAAIWQSRTRTDLIRQKLQANLQQFRKDYTQQFGPNFDVAYAHQSHEMRYFDDGRGATTYRFTVLNLGERPLRQDRLSIRPRHPISTSDMQLTISDVTEDPARPLNHRLALDSDELKIVEVPIPDGLGPRAEFRYEARFILQHDEPSGYQQFDMPTWALSRAVSFNVAMPLSTKPTSAVLVRDTQKDERGIKVTVRREAALHVMSGEIDFPYIGEIPSISFEIE